MRFAQLCGAWILGIAVSLRWPVPPPISLVCLILSFLYLALAVKRGWNRWWGIGLVVFFAATLRPAIQVSPPQELGLERGGIEKAIEVQGIITTFPEVRGRDINFEVGVHKVRTSGEWEVASGSLLVRTRSSAVLPREGANPPLKYGDVLLLRGKLTEPPTFGDFDHRQYLAHSGISFLLSYPKIEVLESGKGFKPLEWIYSARERLAYGIQIALPEPQAALSLGMLVGLRADIPPQVNEAFMRSGTTHILAISGVNIAMVMGLVMAWVQTIWGRRYHLHLLAALVAIWAYTLISGASPPAVRAAVMGSSYLLALALGRGSSNSGPGALLLAASLMVGLAPSLLRDVSFQLSFAAMAGLIFVAPRLSPAEEPPWLARMGTPGSLALRLLSNSFIPSIAATLATYPLTAFYFHRVSLVGIPATALGLPILPPLLTLGFVSGVVGVLAPAIAPLVGLSSWLATSYLLKVADIFARLPMASLDLGQLGEPLVWGYYLLLVAIFWIAGRPKWGGLSLWSQLPGAGHALANAKPFRLPLLALGSFGLFLWGIVLTLPNDNLRVVFLDVGQGDAILIQSPSGKRVLIDGGPDPGVILKELGERLPFWGRTLDLVVLTHSHEDHITGLITVLQRYNVARALESPQMDSSPSYRQWRRIISEKGVSLTTAQQGQVIPLGGGARLEVLNPPNPPWAGTSSDIDNNGVVLRLVYGMTSFLFMADVFHDGEALLLDRHIELGSTVLKVGHHGSNSATSQPFLDKVMPTVAVISVGAGNPFGHPSPEVLQRVRNAVGDSNVLLTRDNGTIEITTNGQRLWLKKEERSKRR